MATLLDSLIALATPAAGALSRRVVESDDAISRGLRASLASVLVGLVTRSDDAAGAGQVFDLISSPANDPSVITNPDELVRGLPASATSGPGRSLLDTVFDGRTDAVGDFIARTAGFRKPASGSTLLAVAASFVLGYLGRTVRDDNLTVDGLTSLLAAERDDVLAAAPPRLMDVIEGRETEPTDDPVFPATAGPVAAAPAGMSGVRDRDVAATPARRSRWLWALTGAAVALLAWLGFCSTSTI
ncbi:MAG TPA: DUF937 domain-containing protein [Gemmatimonadaceae bacterium]|jgi:hypothetical protein|nr:DUF937 domain-containing protein [Gemmatimonadaceae bacterium]